MNYSKGIKLITDFEDYYDEIFTDEYEKTDLVYWRKSNILDKKKQLEYLRDQRGYLIPPILPVSSINHNSFTFDSDQTKVIVLNKNKEYVKSVSRAVSEDFDFFYRPILYGRKAETYKKYKIGGIEITTKEESDHDWRSDMGNSKETIIDINIETEYESPRPMYCMNFVEIGKVRFLTSYKESPKLEYTPIKEALPSEVIYEELQQWFKERRYNGDFH